MSETKPRIGQPVAVIKHSDAAAEWATSDNRTPVFTVTREVPNPRAGMHIDDNLDNDLEPDTIEQETVFTMPDRPNAGLAMAYLKQARANADFAMSWLIETAIGTEGYDAMVDELAGMEPDEAQRFLQDTVTRIQVVAMGGLDNSGNAPKA